MNKADLLQLLASSNRSIGDVRERVPVVFTLLQGLALAEARSQLLAGFNDAPADLKARVTTASLTTVAIAAMPAAVRKAMTGLTQELAEDGNARLEALEQGGAFIDPLSASDVLLDDLALIQDELEQAKVYIVGDIAGVADERFAKVVARAPSLMEIDDEMLASIVAAGELREPKAAELGLTANLFQLCDEDATLTAAVKAAPVGRGPEPKVTAVRDLADLDVKAWRDLLQRSGIVPPSGTDLNGYARSLARRVATLYPAEAFVRRLPAVDEKAIAEHIRTLLPLLARGPAIGRRFEDLPTADLDQAQIRPAHAALSRLSNTYSGLELAAVIENSELTPEKRAEIVVRRTGLIASVLAKHGDKELLDLDYAPDGEDVATLDLGGMGMSADQQRLVVAALKAFQRANTLTDDVEDSHAVLAAGISSATRAATMSLDDFRDATGLDEATARKHHTEARKTLSATTSMAVSAMDVVRGGFDKLHVANVGLDAKEMLRKFEGFSDLFGSQDYCRCTHCRSILGPSAYFVDLMTFVHENVRAFFKNDPDHALNLRTRRPDLWHLPLTCESTDTLVPTLEIANDVLENHIATYVAAKAGTTVPLTPRSGVESWVYEKTLAQSDESFGQPFVWPLERLTAYLRLFKRSRGDIARALGASTDQVTRTELGLGVIERHAIVTPDLRPGALNQLFDTDFEPQSGDPSVLAPVDVERLVHAMGTSRDEIGLIIDSRFVRAGVGRPRIVAGKQAPGSVQNDIEHVHGLTYDALDRIHRFTRLWRRFSWSIGELDLVLTALDDASIEASTLDRLVAVRQARERFGTSVEETCALFSQIPKFPVSADGTALVDQLFNSQGGGADLPDAAYAFLHPALRVAGSQTPPDAALPRLLAGLRVSDEDLVRLITTHLSRRLGVDPASADEEARRFALSAKNLSLLYRHARLAERLKQSIPRLFQLLEIVPGPAGAAIGVVDSLDDLSAVLEFHAWWRSTRYTLDDLSLILGMSLGDPDAYPTASAVATRVIADNGASSTFVFADTVFAVALVNVTEDASRRILQTISASVEAVGDGLYRLAADFRPGVPLNLPNELLAELNADESTVRDVLRRYHAVTVVPSRLSAALQVAADKIDALIDITGRPLVGPGMTLALRVVVPTEGPLPPEAQPLVDLVNALVPLTVLFTHPAFDADAIRFVQNHGSAFGLDNLPAVNIAGIRALSVYSRFAPVASDVQFTNDSPPIDVADLKRVLARFDPASGFAEEVNDDLARVFRTGKRTMALLRKHVALSTPAAAAIEQLANCADLSSRLGVGGPALADAVAVPGAGDDQHERAAREYDQLTHAATAIRAALRAKYPDEADLQAKLDPIEDTLRSRKRDALTDYLIHSYRPAFEDRRAIYEYFLIDVELEGCARTSRLVSATNSLQLYFQRCLMDLEQDRRGGDDHLHVTIGKEAAAEWEWRKAYRVWEANRKVFLYPESYLEPDLRDDKTPLFEELESGLLQKQIDQQAALDAYSAFMDGFEEIGSLTIAGAYYHGPADTLHLVGVTSSDPPTYYYRAIESPFAHGRHDDTIYSPWRKISVQIPVRHASPVVYRKRLYLFWTEIRSQSVNEVVNGSSVFIGYRHTQTLKYTSLRLDGKWTAPQEIQLPKELDDSDHMAGVVTDYFRFRLGDQPDPVVKAILKFDQGRLKSVRHTRNPIEDYTLTGPNWEMVFPDALDSGLFLVMRNFRLVVEVGLFRRFARKVSDVSHVHRIRTPRPRRFLLSTKEDGEKTGLYYGSPTHWYASRNAFANLVLEDERIDMFDGEYGGQNDTKLKAHVHHPKNKIAELSEVGNLLAISGAISNAIVQAGPDAILVRRQPDTNRYRIERLGTTLATAVARKLFAGGVHGLLDLDTQRGLKEAASPLTGLSRIKDATNAGTLDFDGPYGVYYREIFFHIPFLIADHLNSQGQFAAAQRWYHYIFDPTAEGAGVDRVWRYLGLRNQTWPTMRDILTNGAAIEAYESDPFNPHAIARLRLSAYAKSVVMKYVDNLLDWGDRYFAQFTMESVNQATMLYAMAADILGERPYEAGDCGQSLEAMTYAQILPTLGQGSSFLVELESLAAGKRAKAKGRRSTYAARFTVDPEAMSEVRAAVPLAPEAKKAKTTAPGEADDEEDDGRPESRGPAWKNTAAAGWATPATAARPSARRRAEEMPAVATPAAFGWSLVRQIGPAFCVPPNDDLFAYWDRVEDRLYKIHHCLDIHGRRRDLALFAPAIDPRLLVKMKAAGLSLDDVTNATSGDLPPYRFLYLIEKAKAFATTLQSFGSALLQALEKKDAEELARLRLVHEQNVLKMSTQIKQLEIDAAQEAIETVTKQKEAAEFRRDHYQELLDTGLSGWEMMDQIGRHLASGIRGGATPLWVAAAAAGLVPDVGSPFAMKFGGTQVSRTFAYFSAILDTTATVAENMAASSSLEATFDRRREEWQFQRDVADKDVAQLDGQIKAAEIRKEMAVKSLDVHEKTLEQTEEVNAFYADKFSSFGLYTWMSATLQRTYRHAYTNALSIARLCQAAYEFERDDDPGLRVGAGAWDGAHAGLLAGDTLLLDLQSLERRFIETNYRTLEVEQSFALTQIDPAALLALQESAECQFEIPEVFFDLVYPGHYRRRIKAVRLTIPCVTGPYTNVGATLTLTGSKVRQKPNPAANALKPMPPKRTVSIATSKAQNDAGVFELSFHDERYMPFEGAGAVSTWKLELPRNFRPFDYQTISDVVLTINYTTLADDGLRKTVESQNDQLQGAILKYLSENSLVRIFSLRQEFPLAYRALLNSPLGTPVTFEIKDWHFPAFVMGNGLRLRVTDAKLALKPSKGASLAGVQLTIDGETVSGFTGDENLGRLAAKTLEGQFPKTVRGEHTVALNTTGTLGEDTLADLLFRVGYRVILT